jgi:hypothetical protein
MFKATAENRHLWREDELDRFNDYMASKAPLWSSSDEAIGAGQVDAYGMVIAGPPPESQTIPGIGHNTPPPDVAHLHAVSAERIRRAIRDDQLDRGHLKVLANLWERLNATTWTAWPSRELIAQQEGLDVKSVNNNLYDLRRRGYIDWGRLPDPKRPRRTLQHYWWLEDEIAKAVAALRAKIALQEGQKMYPPQRAVSEMPSPEGTKSALPKGNKESSLSKSTDATNDAVAIRAIRPAAPQLTAEALVISVEHGLTVPIQTVQAWRERFPHIPDLEAAMIGLGTTILSKGMMHPGWTCPEGWMVKPLAAMNQEAADRNKVTAARVARASNGSAAPRGRNRRAELDNV